MDNAEIAEDLKSRTADHAGPQGHRIDFSFQGSNDNVNLMIS